MNIYFIRMCFNAEVSITTYMIGIVFSIILYLRGFKTEALFYGWVCHMQLIEFVLHLSQSRDHRTVSINKVLTRIGIIVNHLEPYVLYAAILVFNRGNITRMNMIIMHVYMALMVPPTLYFSKDVVARDIEPTNYKIGHCESTKLIWKWNYRNNSGMYYIMFIVALVLLFYYGGFDKRRSMYNIIAAITTYTVSWVIYKDEKAVGSMWCFFAAFAPLALNIVS